MPNVLIAACVTQGVALGYGQQLGLQPAATRLLDYLFTRLLVYFVIFGCARQYEQALLRSLARKFLFFACDV